MINQKNDNVLLSHLQDSNNRIINLENLMGGGSLSTTAQTLIGAINENKTSIGNNYTTLNNKFNDYLPLIGGTLTGDLFGSNIYQNGNKVLNENEIKGLPYACVYYSGSGDTSFNASPIKFNTIARDTHNAYSTSTGYFICPIAGIYYAAFSYYSNSPGNNSARPRIWHTDSSGSDKSDGGVQLNGQSAVSVTNMFYCEAGDRIYAGPQNSNYTLSLYAAAAHNEFVICCLRPL